MISYDEFKDAMNEVCLLAGQNPSKEQMQAIYRRIKYYELKDFLKACNDETMLEELSYRMNYPSIRRALDKYRLERLNREIEIRKKQEREDLNTNQVMPEEIKRFIRTLGRL